MKTTVRIRVEGRVQGVGYRAFVEFNATQLNIDGWVRNRRDGSVENSEQILKKKVEFEAIAQRASRVI